MPYTKLHSYASHPAQDVLADNARRASDLGLSGRDSHGFRVLGFRVYRGSGFRVEGLGFGALGV